MDCSNHQHFLSETSAVAAISPNTIPWMYSACLFLRMGANGLRLVHGVSELVERDMPFSRREFPPPEAAAYSQEIKAFALENMKQFNCDDESDDESFGARAGRRRKRCIGRKRQADYETAWDAFLTFFNGWLVASTLGYHHCLTEECCQSFDHSVTKKRAKKVIVGLFFRSLPSTPTKKWTKLMPCVTWFTVSFLMNLLVELMPISFSRLRITTISQNAAAGLDQEFLAEVAYHNVQGKRYGKFLTSVRSKHHRTMVLIMAIIVEPLAWLGKWFLHCSSYPRRMRRQRQGLSPCDVRPLPTRVFACHLGAAVLVVDRERSRFEASALVGLHVQWLPRVG